MMGIGQINKDDYLIDQEKLMDGIVLVGLLILGMFELSNEMMGLLLRVSNVKMAMIVIQMAEIVIDRLRMVGTEFIILVWHFRLEVPFEEIVIGFREKHEMMEITLTIQDVYLIEVGLFLAIPVQEEITLKMMFELAYEEILLLQMMSNERMDQQQTLMAETHSELLNQDGLELMTLQ